MPQAQIMILDEKLDLGMKVIELKKQGKLEETAKPQVLILAELAFFNRNINSMIIAIDFDGTCVTYEYPFMSQVRVPGISATRSRLI
jgi:hypothetical protein